jgi:hypothetical protein
VIGTVGTESTGDMVSLIADVDDTDTNAVAWRGAPRISVWAWIRYFPDPDALV